MTIETYRWQCACCGREMTGLPLDLGYRSPAGWDELDEAIKLRSLLTDDFCLIRHDNGATDRYIRCILPLPVSALGSEFRFGVWMSVSEESWKVYQLGFETDEYSREGCFGYLANELQGFEGSYLLHANVWFQKGHQRPRVVLHDADHPLVYAQQTGLEIAQIESWASMMHREVE